MNKFKLLLTLLCAWVGVGVHGAITTPATIPFTTTTVTNGSENFELGTKWYTIKNHDNKYLATCASHLDGSGFKPVATAPDGETGYWCFTGSQTDGFTLYNRPEGTSKVFAFETTSKAKMMAYDANVNCKTFDLVNSFWEGYYAFRRLGSTNNFVNIDGGSTNNSHLVFWNDNQAIWGWGKNENNATGDAGSAWQIVEVAVEIEVVYKSNGTTTQTDRLAKPVGTAISDIINVPLGYSFTCDYENTVDGTYSYTVNLIQDKVLVNGITLNYVHKLTGASLGSTDAGDQYEDTPISQIATGIPAGYVYESAQPYEVVTVGTTTYTVYCLPDYSVVSAAQGTFSRNDRWTEYITLQVDSRDPQRIDGLQPNTGNKPVYFDLTSDNSKRFTCYPGATLTPALDNSNMKAMQGYCYLDEGNDGFSYDVDETNHCAKEGSDLKAWGGYHFGTSTWYNSKGVTPTSDKTDNPATFITMPSFTAPTAPGLYRMRYKIDWDNIDPKGASSIATNGGIIVDVILEVVDIPVYTVTVNHIVNGTLEEQEAIKVMGDDEENIGFVATPLAKYASRFGVTITNEAAQDITADTEININYTQDDSVMPFVPATVDADGNLTNCNYYKLKLHDKYAWCDPSTGCDQDRWYCNGTEDWKGDARDYFFFVGNVFDGFSIHSVVEGENKGFNVENKRFETTFKKYYLVDSPAEGEEHGYGFNLVGTAKGINDDSGSGVVGSWNTANFASHNCHFEFTAVDPETAERQIAIYREHIASLLPVDGKRYYIVSALPGFESHDNGNHKKKTVYLDGTTLKWKTIDNLDKRAMWTWTATEGGYTVKNVANPDAEVHCASSSDAHSSNPIRLWWLSDNQFNIQDGADHVWHAIGHGSGANLTGEVSTYGGAASSPSAWRLVEVSEDLWEAACAKEALQSLVASAETAMQTEEYTSTTNIITSADQLASNAGHNELGNSNDGGGIPALVDGDYTTLNSFFHSSWGNNTTANPNHLLQIDFLKTRQYVQLKWWRRNNGNDNNRPKTVEVWGTNDDALAALAEGKSYTTVDYDQTTWNEGWNQISTLNIDNSTNPVITNYVNLGGYRYIRLNVTSTSTGTTFFTMAEIQAYEQNADLINAILAANDVLNSGSEDAADYNDGIAAIKAVLSAPLRAALNAVVTDYESRIGSKLGKYSVSGVTDAAQQLSEARALANDTNADVDDLQATIEALNGWTFSLNMPQAGLFIRIQGASTKWITAEAKTINSLNQMAMGTDKESANTIFYVTESGMTNSGQGTAKLLSYGKGVYVVSTFGLGAVGAEGYEFAFGDSKVEDNLGNAGQYNIRVEQSNNTRTAYLYDSGNNNNRVSTDRNGDPHTNTVWTLEEVTSLPVTIGETGYASLNLPVATILPEGIDAWYSSKVNSNDETVDDNTIVLKKIASGNVLPASTPVVLHKRNDAESESPYTFNVANTTERYGIPETDEMPLKGTVAAQNVEANSVFVLGIDNRNENRIGFFNYTGTTLDGFKAYIPKAEGASNIRIAWSDVETAIEAIENDDLQTGVMYNLNGQRVMKGHGFVIVNGKKMIIK